MLNKLINSIFDSILRTAIRIFYRALGYKLQTTAEREAAERRAAFEAETRKIRESLNRPIMNPPRNRPILNPPRIPSASPIPSLPGSVPWEEMYEPPQGDTLTISKPPIIQRANRRTTPSGRRVDSLGDNDRCIFNSCSNVVYSNGKAEFSKHVLGDDDFSFMCLDFLLYWFYASKEHELPAERHVDCVPYDLCGMTLGDVLAELESVYVKAA